jgi:hypothetical protein
MKRAAVDPPLLVLATLLLALFVGHAIWPEASLYRDVVGITTRLYVGGVCKLAALLLGAIQGWRVAARFAPGNPSRRAWQALSVWLSAWSIAQACLGWYQWVRSRCSCAPM